ncbi:hypothetical protein Poly59_36230 [Rubripirellula reticaptiva]|uniref:Uncharacterized protein n=1 Tax=Rubripirellula reticaptiva TaxID=2528013 RepID=A0A5C6EWG0_9BACT|nr:hypothetical protein Poly59_36230 [Rubripirellula reticaptiva]
MRFGLRLILASFAAFGAGALFISDSFTEPLEGLEPQPMWKGVVAVILGLALLGFGLKYIIDERRANKAIARSSDEST